MTIHPPDNLVPGHTSPTFTEKTLPAALQAEHTLAPGHWAVLNVLEGRLRFVNLDTDEDRVISGPDHIAIPPGLPHRVAIEGPLLCSIDFFREPSDAPDGPANDGSRIGDIMNSAADMGKRGIRTAQAGVTAVTGAAAKLPGIGRGRSGADEAGKTESTPEYTIVQDLPDPLKESYLSVLVWLVHADDEYIDERELCEIQVLMTQLQCSPEVRRTVRSQLEDPDTLDAEAQIARLLELVPTDNADTASALRYSLIKDAIRVARATSEGDAREQPGIGHLAGLLDLDDKQVAVIEVACEQDEKILSGDLSDSQLKSVAKELAGRATAVGVPIAAIYLSGSVTGLSAAGITSGLAALGLGGVLGLSAMVTGIGVAIVAGGAAYKGVRWALGGAERGRGSLRELMLQEVLRIHQTAIINLAEDISCFGERVAALTAQTHTNRKAIDQLAREVTLLTRSTGALTRLRERTSGFERDLEAAAAHAAR